jgi:hypothetical protein
MKKLIVVFVSPFLARCLSCLSRAKPVLSVIERIGSCHLPVLEVSMRDYANWSPRISLAGVIWCGERSPE